MTTGATTVEYRDPCVERFGPGTGLDLPQPLAREVFRRSARRRFGPGEVIFHAGDLGDSLFLICDGRVALRSFWTNGNSVTTSVLGAGDLVGLHSVFDPGTRHPVTAQAVDRTHVQTLRLEDWQSLCGGQPVLALRLARWMTRHAAGQSTRLVEACWERSDARVRARLLEMVERFGRADEAHGITLVIAHEELAELAGVARPTVSAVIQTGIRSGVLVGGRRRITVPHLERLRTWCARPDPPALDTDERTDLRTDLRTDERITTHPTHENGTH